MKDGFQNSKIGINQRLDKNSLQAMGSLFVHSHAEEFLTFKKEEWMGTSTQTDDITLIGIKF